MLKNGTEGSEPLRSKGESPKQTVKTAPKESPKETQADVPKKQPKNSNVEWLFEHEEQKSVPKEKFLSKLFQRDVWKLVYTTLIYFLQHAPAYLMPLITSEVIDLITYRPPNFLRDIVFYAVFSAVLIIQNVPTTIWRSKIIYKWIRNVSAEIKSGVIRKLSRLSITYHKEIEEGKIQSKFLRDIEKVESYYINILLAFIPCLFATVIAIVISLVKSPIVTLFFLVVVPINLLLARLFSRRIRKESRNFREENEKLSAKMTTSLQMLTLTKAHGLVQTEEQALEKRIDSVARAGFRVDMTVARFGSMTWVCSQFLSAVCLFFCAYLAYKNVITLGEVVLFQSLFSSINGNVSSLINLFPSIINGREAVHSLSEIICADELEHDEGKRKVGRIKGKIDFDSADMDT